MNNMNNSLHNRFSLRKIPALLDQNNTEILTDEGIDKIKIIELSTAIDKWEQEVLFCENGFYSLKGRDAQKKKKAYLAELDRFIAGKIAQMAFSFDFSREAAHKIKQQKIDAVKFQLEEYSQAQLQEWENQTYEDALSTTIKRAVLYKNNPEIIKVSFKNGFNIISIIADKEDWSEKLRNYKNKQFVSDFWLAIINEFIKDKDINAYHYFENYKNLINSADKEKLEKQVQEMRINIIANNWAKEVYSYKLDEKDFQKELNKINDEDIKIAAGKFYSAFKKSERRINDSSDKEKNIANWNEIIDITSKDIDIAELYIDYSSKIETINRKKDYINQIRLYGKVKTDEKQFIKLFKEIFADFQAFKDKDISDFHGCLSAEDYNIFARIQKYNDDEFTKIDCDLRYAIPLLEELDINTDEEKYKFIKLYFSSLSEYQSKKKEKADLDARQKLMDSVSLRFKPQERKDNK